MNPRGAPPKAGAVQDAANPATLSEYAEGRAGRYQRITKDAEQLMTHAKMMKTKSWQYKHLMQ